MSNLKRTLLAVGAAAALLTAGLSPAAAEILTSSGCIEYSNNTCTKLQTCSLDTSTGHGSCTYSYAIRGRWVEVYSEPF